MQGAAAADCARCACRVFLNAIAPNRLRGGLSLGHTTCSPNCSPRPPEECSGEGLHTKVHTLRHNMKATRGKDEDETLTHHRLCSPLQGILRRSSSFDPRVEHRRLRFPRVARRTRALALLALPRPPSSPPSPSASPPQPSTPSPLVSKTAPDPPPSERSR